uniref:activator of basal transcription 1-like n=1 Tax=Styela clava TaxID=7725 RepID=UPI00193A7143|nr:activator of basal transcription 1-like [Styela clava]XP_039267644.1 activator of basal transcription 1-like [Styela clava]
MEDDTNAVTVSTDQEDLSDETKMTIPGVMYISTIPPGITPIHLKQVFERYGEVGRIFLQPDEKGKKRGKRKRTTFTRGRYSEGWVEMADKKLAKRIALTLNNTPVMEWKKSKCVDYIWNVKYLHRFRWTHLNERLSYERAVRQQKMRTEFAQARRETEAFIANVDASKKWANIKERKQKKGIKLTETRRENEIKQRKTVAEMRKEKSTAGIESKSKSILSNIFAS